jgi:hypothetical protein
LLDFASAAQHDLIEENLRGSALMQNSMRLKTFVVNSDVPPQQLDIAAWWKSVPQLLHNAKIEDVKIKTVYCCTPDRKVIAEFEAPDKEAVRSALSKISMPFTTVMEATKVG